MRPCEIRVEQCEAARRIEDDFGTDKALDYLIAEKFLNSLEAAGADIGFRDEFPAFGGTGPIPEDDRLGDVTRAVRVFAEGPVLGTGPHGDRAGARKGPSASDPPSP